MEGTDSYCDFASYYISLSIASIEDNLLIHLLYGIGTYRLELMASPSMQGPTVDCPSHQHEMHSCHSLYCNDHFL